MCKDKIMIALAACDIIHDTDADEVILSRVIDDDAVIGIAAFRHRRIPLTGDKPMPVQKMMQNTIIVVFPVRIQIPNEYRIIGWCS